MKTEFVLRFNVYNATTHGDANVADILKKTAEQIEFTGIQDNRHYNLRDLKGNVVGKYGRYTTEDEPTVQ